MTTIKTEMNNPFYNAIQALEPAVPVLSTIVSCVNADWVGCSVGFAAGTIDVAAQHYELYGRPYLTGGMLGYSALAAFKTPAMLLIDASGVSYALHTQRLILDNQVFQQDK